MFLGAAEILILFPILYTIALRGATTLLNWALGGTPNHHHDGAAPDAANDNSDIEYFVNEAGPYTAPSSYAPNTTPARETFVPLPSILKSLALGFLVSLTIPVITLGGALTMAAVGLKPQLGPTQTIVAALLGLAILILQSAAALRTWLPTTFVRGLTVSLVVVGLFAVVFVILRFAFA